MQTNDQNPIETLRNLVAQLHNRYLAIEEKVEAMSRNKSSANFAADLKDVNERLAGAGVCEKQMADIRATIEKSGDALPADIRSKVDAALAVVTNLVPRVAMLEKQAREAREQLAPRIHEGVKGIQMRSAYSRTTAKK